MSKYILVAGVNGAGKSTLYYSLSAVHGVPYVNVDEILRSFGNWQQPENVIRAGKIAVQQIEHYFDEGVTFCQETTLCGKSIIRNVANAKRRGYNIEVYYIGVESADIAKERVHQRIARGGHGIPNEDIERRYEESFSNMLCIRNDCDAVTFYDNTLEFRQIAVWRGREITNLTCVLPGWYKKYFGELPG